MQFPMIQPVQGFCFRVVIMLLKSIVDEWNYNRDQRILTRAFGSFYTQLNIGSIFPALTGLKYRLNFGPDISYSRDGVYIDANSVANGGSTNYGCPH
jgi:hypothetical protein